MRFIFYLLPCLLNIVSGLLFFITAKRAADADVPSLAVTATLSIWAVIYAASSFIAGRYTTRENAVKTLFVSQFILLLSLAGLLLTPSVKLQYLYLLGCGCGLGLFFTPFQAVVKLFEDVEISAATFSRSAAKYTFSWSFGQGTGPLLAGVIWGMFDPVNGWKYCYMITIGIVLFDLVSLISMQKFIRRKLAISATSENTPANTSSEMESTQLPDIMKAVWILCIGGFLAISVLRSYLPDYATKVLNLPTSAQGIALALISLVQAFVALACCKSQRWQFRPIPMFAAMLLGCGALLLAAFSASSWAIYLAAAMFGIFTGLLCFMMTYHALANAAKSARYAAGNETIVGGTAVLAPLAAGAIADFMAPQTPFYLLIGAMLISAVIYCRKIWQYRNF